MTIATEQDPLHDDGGEPAAADRRRARRHATVLLVGKVRHRGSKGTCLIHDISPGGLLARFGQVPAVGDEVEIAARGLGPTSASVRWVKGYKAGLAFATQQDVAGVLGGKGERVPRASRFDVNLATELQAGADRQAVELVDVSPGGAKLVTDDALDPGSAVRLSLPGTSAPVPATICWSRDGRAGLRFTFGLEMGTLAHLIELDDGRA